MFLARPVFVVGGWNSRSSVPGAAIPAEDSDDDDFFEREELSQSSSDGGQAHAPQPAKRCDIAQSMLRRMREVDNEMGDGLMSLLETAEAQPEGYYLATANRLKTIHEHRMENLSLHNELVAHHQRAHAFCDETKASRDRLEQRNAELLKMTTTLQGELKKANDETFKMSVRLKDLEQQTEALECTANGFQNQIECLTIQLESRNKGYRAKLKAMEAALAEEKRKQSSHRRLISFLNKKTRDIVKRVREGVAGTGRPKCHVLGTYDDVLGAPV
jgi:hypothetical protein